MTQLEAYGFGRWHKNTAKIFLLLRLAARWDRSLPGTAGTCGTRILLPCGSQNDLMN